MYQYFLFNASFFFIQSRDKIVETSMFSNIEGKMAFHQDLPLAVLATLGKMSLNKILVHVI